MDRNPATSHAAHDELLLARLYGGDLEGPERDRANELVASCSLCAAAYSDFGSIANALVSLRTPRRPREFTLTPADAARRRSWRGALLSGLGRLGPVRTLGTSMAAVGLVGVLAVGAISALVPATNPANQQSRWAGPLGAVPEPASSAAYTNEQAGGWAAASAAPAATSEPAKAAATAAGPIPTNLPAVIAASPAAATPAASPAPSPAATEIAYALSPAPPASGVAPSANDVVDMGALTTGDVSPTGGPTTGQGALPASSGPDARSSWLLGFAVLAAAGFIVLTAPALLRRRPAGLRRR